jgi:DNA-binding MarR family transcriptional regulator
MARGPKSRSSLFHHLHRASERADGLFARNVRESDLTHRQFAVLQAVADQGGLSQTEIMKATGIDRSSTADLVRRLVTIDCLRRRRTRRDARSYAVRITARGRQMLDIGLQATLAAESELLRPIPQKERASFLALLMLVAMSPYE